MLSRIESAVKLNDPRLDSILAAILAEDVCDPGLLHGFDLAASPERYARHLLYRGDDYTLLALVWLPGQMSQVHGHRRWCALAVHRGCLTETLFGQNRQKIDLVSGRQLFPGNASHSPHDLASAHRIANLGVETAVSLHVYGADYDRLGHDVNHFWAN
jgi:predicted metal-dependent enzyme (double-stranded beta helix superfamily)